MRKMLAITVLGLAMVFGFSTMALAASSGTEIPVDSGSSTFTEFVPATSATVNDNVYGNANNTGKNVFVNDGTSLSDVIKSDGMKMNDPTSTQTTQRTHGEYQNNTNSCASCHQTHTASAAKLLFKDGVYTTCTACHDGTLGFYNVFDGSTAGTFGGTHSGNASVHLANNTVKISAAPGGNQLSVDSSSWGAQFNCASCHSAHGSYSDRLLNYNPNNMGATAVKDGGIALKQAPVIAFADIAAEAAKMDTVDITKPLNQLVVVKGTKAELDITDANIGGTDKVVAVYEWKKGTPNTYVKTTAPWLYGYGAYSKPANYFTRFYLTSPTDFTKDAKGNYTYIADYVDIAAGVFQIQFDKGYAYAPTGGLLDNAVLADVGRAYQVKMDLYDIGDYGGLKIKAVNETAFYAGTKMDNTTTSGMGVTLSKYCAACHTDYMNKAGSLTGTFSTAYRHNTTSDSYTCVRCHFAHGTDVTIMKDAHNENVDEIVADGTMNVTQATAYMLDKNPSSALKRYTNMSVCWACHTSSHAVQLKNNDYVMSGTNDTPHGLTDTTLPTVPASVTYP